MKLLVPFIAVLLLVGCATSGTTGQTSGPTGQWYSNENNSLESIAPVGDYAEIYTRDNPMKIIQMRIIDAKEASITGDNLYITNVYTTNGPQPEGVLMTIDRSNILKIFISKDQIPKNEYSVGETASGVGKAAFTAGAILLCTAVIVGEIIDGSGNPDC